MMTLEQAMVSVVTGFGCFFVMFLLAAIYCMIMVGSGKWIEVEEEEVVYEAVNRKGVLSPWKRAGFVEGATFKDDSQGQRMVTMMYKRRIKLFKGVR